MWQGLAPILHLFILVPCKQPTSIVYTHSVQILLNSLALAELHGWVSPTNLYYNGSAIHFPPIDLTIATDASTRGWEWYAKYKDRREMAFCEAKNHINHLELKVALLAIQALLKKENPTPQRLKLLIDNTSAVAYIKKKDGTRSARLTQLAMEIWIYCFLPTFGLQQCIFLG